MYIPFNRLKRKTIGEAFGKKFSAGEKAVACYDEDSFTMGLSAAMKCQTVVGAAKLDALFFASTTATSTEKQSAAHIASVLDIEGELRTADFAGSLRAGTSAILSALDIAKQGGNVLAVASDARLGAASGKFEETFGDGAAAIRFGNKAVMAQFVDSYSVAHDFQDIWRLSGEKYPHFFDEKYALEMGCIPFVTEAVAGLFKKTGLSASQITKVVLDAADLHNSSIVLSKCGFVPAQAQPQLITEFGYSGVAYAPLLLIDALEHAKVGDMILYISYGEGSDAILFKVLKESKAGAGCGRKYYTICKKNTLSYEKYLGWKKILATEPPRRPVPTRSSLPDFYRKRAKNLALCGSVCKVCGTPQYPPGRVCVRCHAVDQMKAYKLLGRKVSLASFTFDYIAFSEDSPNIVAVADFEGGGRIFTNLMDGDKDKLEIGMPLEMTYRKSFTADGIITYAWKCVPAVRIPKEGITYE